MKNKSSLPLTCNHWGTYRVECENGRVKALHDFEEDSDPSPIGYGVASVLDGPTRITSPMIRKSWLDSGPGSRTDARGSDPFVRVSWDDAERLAANELARVRSKFGNSAIYAGSYGWASAGRFHHAQSQMRRFLNCIGGHTSSVGSYSLAAAESIVPHVLGNFHKLVDQSTGWPSIVANTELFVAFGGIPLRNSQINAGGLGSHFLKGGLESARRAGIKFMNISPIKADMLDTVEGEWMPLLPGSDVAILLGIAHTLCSENLHDEAFLARYTVGFDRFLAYLNGKTDGVEKSADWASSLSSIGSEDIRMLARRMAASRTMINVSWSLNRQDHGEQPYWAAIAVAAMLGQLGLPGGGIGFGYGAVNTVGEHYSIIPAKSFPQLRNPVEKFIPVARVSDMLLNPGEPFDFDGQRYEYPDIRLVYWTGGNPFHHHQDINKLLRAWRKPETVIVHDWCWNSLAKHSDIVLPCTTPLERNDIMISRDPYIVYMQKAVDPPGECRNDFEIFKGIAARMGVLDEFDSGVDEAGWIEFMYEETRKRTDARNIFIPPFSKLRETGWFRVDPPARPRVFLSDFRNDPDRHPLETPSGKIEIFSETVARFGYDDCPGHAAWLEPAEWLGSGKKDFPLHLISNQPKTKLHSQLDHGPASLASKLNAREPVAINPEDARVRKISAGDIVRVFNNRGQCLGAAKLDSDIRPGVVQMSTGAWLDQTAPGKPGSMCKHGNPNVLTLDKGTSRLAQGPIAHTCLVDIELFRGAPPPVTAHEPPRILPN
ncbi:MAG: molybdopterin-dependent oxidoreductase [Albidovulum sp.]|nr:molybdopterin-dependent oxidoreductase [Albidovulum sp.]